MILNITIGCAPSRSEVVVHNAGIEELTREVRQVHAMLENITKFSMCKVTYIKDCVALGFYSVSIPATLYGLYRLIKMP